MRRLLAVAAALAVAHGGVAVAATTVKARLPRCLSFSDAKGDSGVGAPAATGDPTLDLTKSVVGVRGDALVTVMTVEKLALEPQKAWGDRFQLNFAFDGKQVEVYFKRSRTQSAESLVYYQRGVRVNNSFKTSEGVTADFNLSANTVTLAVKLATLRAALGRAVTGGTLGQVSTVAFGGFVVQNFTWDTASAGTASFKVSACV